ncbi:MAG: Lipoprotein-releasing system ATP-binding protein LolD [Alphaproteobacteria bacterium MarineAlpha5_Bin8]|nr:MAG: Lipoprotein-releasing system ATP-binding protein LolD [Alphaproteobacteria bacterium MarineAlpha5_Bin7]PPR47497.1 MAG: Lipoprotein-releasing system ATP-binding protein LolD [Alphaproteobacteria bacterium MarineAlpha5_Bin8]|tara:strand:+ start:432 stop:1115 length:684 start_codon:yes stop_codon:yes gene_type:complete
MTSNLIIEIKDLSKEYIYKKSNLLIFKNINLNIDERDIISIMGPSGCGKSTFLNIIGMLDSDYNGKYLFDNQEVNLLNNDKKNILRNTSIGFVHQFFYLIPELTVLENVAIPKMILTNNKKKSFDSAKYLIEKFGLIERINFKPQYLSGGEQQRVAIARALINNPKLIIADEMTGNLDEETSDNIFNFFLKEIKSNKQSLIFVTHNEKYAKKANKQFKILKKQIIKI